MTNLVNQIVVPIIGMQRYMGQITPRGDDLEIITTRTLIQTQKQQVFFPRNMPQQNQMFKFCPG